VVKELDKQHIRAPLKGARTLGPQAIGFDEISIRRRPTYRLVVSDLIRLRPNWLSGQSRTETSMDAFYTNRQLRPTSPKKKSALKSGTAPVITFHPH